MAALTDSDKFNSSGGSFNVFTDAKVKFLGTEPDNVAQVTHEPIGELLVVHFVQDVATFVVAQSPTQLFVIHCTLALLLTPQSGHALGLAHDELPVETVVAQRPTDNISEREEKVLQFTNFLCEDFLRFL